MVMVLTRRAAERAEDPHTGVPSLRVPASPRETFIPQTLADDNYLQIADNTGSRYLWDPTEPIATRPLVWLHGGNTYSYTHDGNKNVSEVVDANGTVTAHYEYAPFGDVTVSAGNLASFNRFRFSSEYADDALGLVYYNYRHYEPVTGRWMGRDPIGDTNCLCLYLFCRNNLFWSFDQLGLKCNIYIMIGHFPGLDEESELNLEGSIWKTLEGYLGEGDGECDGTFSLSCHMVSFLKGVKDKHGKIFVPDNWPPDPFKDDRNCQIPWFVNFVKSGDFERAIEELTEKIKNGNCCCKKVVVKTYCDSEAVSGFEIYSRPGVGALPADKNPCQDGGKTYEITVSGDSK